MYKALLLSLSLAALPCLQLAAQDTLRVLSWNIFMLPDPLVVNNHPQHPNFGLPTGLSGLRFTDLTSASIPERNDSNVVLSVDLNGDVILVPSVPQEQFFALEARLAQTEKRLAELEGRLFALAARAE